MSDRQQETESRRRQPLGAVTQILPQKTELPAIVLLRGRKRHQGNHRYRRCARDTTQPADPVNQLQK